MLYKTGEFVSATGLDFDLDLSPWQLINKKKWLAREAFKVRTKPGWYVKLILRLEDAQ